MKLTTSTGKVLNHENVKSIQIIEIPTWDHYTIFKIVCETTDKQELVISYHRIAESAFYRLDEIYKYLKSEEEHAGNQEFQKCEQEHFDSSI